MSNYRKSEKVNFINKVVAESGVKWSDYQLVITIGLLADYVPSDYHKFLSG